MSLTIVATQPVLSEKLNRILTNYFGEGSNNPSQILNIKTKYYTCEVPIKIVTPTQIAQQDQQKIDLLVFLFGHDEQMEGLPKFVDSMIAQHCPESQIIFVETKKEIQEEDWMYQDQMAECDNFVAVVYEDLDDVLANVPSWNEGGLLQENDEEYEIFSLFQMIQTTSWTNSVKQTPKEKQRPKQGEVSEEVDEGKKQIHANDNKEEEEVDEEKLEKDMMEFEQLMQQMMMMKDPSLKGNERKVRAEELIMKLAGSIDY